MVAIINRKHDSKMEVYGKTYKKVAKFSCDINASFENGKQKLHKTYVCMIDE